MTNFEENILADSTAEKLQAAAIAEGASNAAVIPVSNVVLDDSFRKICESNGCGCYGKCWMCPPDSGEIHQQMEQVRKYTTAILYQYVGEIEDSFDIEGMAEVKKRHVALCQRVSRRAKEILGTSFLHLGAGGCVLCEKCTKLDGKPCRHPDLAIPSMESAGIDVYHTAKTANMKYINGENTVTYFGIVLFN